MLWIWTWVLLDIEYDLLEHCILKMFKEANSVFEEENIAQELQMEVNTTVPPQTIPFMKLGDLVCAGKDQENLGLSKWVSPRNM